MRSTPRISGGGSGFVGVEMAEGLLFFRRSPVLPLLAVLTAGLALLQAAVLSPFVLFALRDLRLSKAGYGLFLAVTALGNVEHVAPVLRRRYSTATILSIGGTLAGVAYLVVAATSSVIVAADSRLSSRRPRSPRGQWRAFRCASGTSHDRLWGGSATSFGRSSGGPSLSAHWLVAYSPAGAACEPPSWWPVWPNSPSLPLQPGRLGNSMPAVKARSPAPVRITAPTRSSASICKIS